jgi:hypothetical protein
MAQKRGAHTGFPLPPKPLPRKCAHARGGGATCRRSGRSAAARRAAQCAAALRARLRVRACGRAHAVFCVLVRSILQQQGDHSHVAVKCGQVQRRPAILHAPRRSAAWRWGRESQHTEAARRRGRSGSGGAQCGAACHAAAEALRCAAPCAPTPLHRAPHSMPQLPAPAFAAPAAAAPPCLPQRRKVGAHGARCGADAPTRAQGACCCRAEARPHCATAAAAAAAALLTARSWPCAAARRRRVRARRAAHVVFRLLVCSAALTQRSNDRRVTMSCGTVQRREATLCARPRSTLQHNGGGTVSAVRR